MKEIEMFEPIINLLESKGYKLITANRGRKHGSDIIAEFQGHNMIMEMKGDTAALDVDLGTCIFQLMRHIHKGSANEYAIGISEAYVRLIRQIENPLRKLNIKVFVVNENSYQLW